MKKRKRKPKGVISVSGSGSDSSGGEGCCRRPVVEADSLQVLVERQGHVEEEEEVEVKEEVKEEVEVAPPLDRRTLQAELLHWIQERQKIYHKKEINKEEKPWTSDPILLQYRCGSLKRLGSFSSIAEMC